MTTLQEVIDQRFNGILVAGAHIEDSYACIFEAASVLKEIPWTDAPDKLRCFDIRALNDGPWTSDAGRTRYMVSLYLALEGSLDWPIQQQQRFVKNVMIRTVREIIAELPELGASSANECRAANTLAAAKAALAAVMAVAAAKATANWAAAGAADAAKAAGAASWAAWVAKVAAEAILIKACRIWIEAAREVQA